MNCYRVIVFELETEHKTEEFLLLEIIKHTILNNLNLTIIVILQQTRH